MVGQMTKISLQYQTLLSQKPIVCLNWPMKIQNVVPI